VLDKAALKLAFFRDDPHGQGHEFTPKAFGRCPPDMVSLVTISSEHL
jgi:hypothetical protein